jgi:transcriptional regulator with XRE-family HTH domain
MDGSVTRMRAADNYMRGNIAALAPGLKWRLMATANRLSVNDAASYGARVRAWRHARGLSQIDLATRAGFSTRHVSFVETGRTRPSRETVLTLAEALDVPLRERNLLLEAAGFARIFRETALTSDEMAHVRGVLQFILDRHLPYPALVLDRHSTCLQGNRAAGHLLSMLVAPSLLAKGTNQLRAVFHPDGVRRSIVNWPEVESYLLRRAERELGGGDDPAGTELLAEIRTYANGSAISGSSTPLRPTDLLLPIHIRMGDLDLRLFSTIMTLGTPQDVTLQELRIETFFPADEESERCWSRLYAAVNPQDADRTARG